MRGQEQMSDQQMNGGKLDSKVMDLLLMKYCRSEGTSKRGLFFAKTSESKTTNDLE